MHGYLFDVVVRHVTAVLMRREMFSIVAAAIASHFAGGACSAVCAQ